MRILLDMDDVLADFVGGACRAWGRSAAAVKARWEPGVWDVIPPLSLALGADPPLTPERFWTRLTNGGNFWLGLQPHDWAGRLLETVRSLTDDWYVVTSPARCPHSYGAKVEWLREFLGDPLCDRCIPTRHKHLFANPKTVLVDDCDANVNRFRQEGGYGIVWPAHQNSLHRVTDPFEYVYVMLTSLNRKIA